MASSCPRTGRANPNPNPNPNPDPDPDPNPNPNPNRHQDPLRVQPHLKKCFEGIAQLTFTPQLIIVGMESVEGEKVGFSTSLNPAEANGMVEKWLLQVAEPPVSRSLCGLVVVVEPPVISCLAPPRASATRRALLPPPAPRIAR